ncbi:hypothetical protein Gpo141_00006600 [Globisporangium polare]
MTTTTRTTTTTTTVQRRHPSASIHSSVHNNLGLYNSSRAFGLRPQSQMDRAMPSAATSAAARADAAAELFQRKMLEEPHFAEFYANIWSDEDRKQQQQQRKKRGRREPDLSDPLIDIAQVAHVVTTVLKYKNDYAPVLHPQDEFNLWADKDRACLTDEELEKIEDDEANADLFQIDHSEGAAAAASVFEIRERARSRSASGAIHVSAFAHSERPRRISEASDEGSVDLYASVPATAVVLGGQRQTTRHSDPLETSFEDSDETEDTAATGGIHPSMSDLQRSNAALVMCSDRGAGIKALLTMPSGVDSAVPPPSSRRNGSAVFSVVFREEREWGWSAKFLLGLHEPIRHALFVMDRFLEQSYNAQEMTALEKQVQQFFVWFKTYFVEYLKCQHSLKTTVLHPLIQLKYSTKQEVAKTYEEIFHCLEQIQHEERALCSTAGVNDASTWLARLESLQQFIRKLHLTLKGVLNLEEKTLYPALSAAFTETTFHRYVMPRVFKSIKAKRVVVPWILERSKVWGGEAEQQSIKSMLPFSARFMYKKIWHPYFMSNVAGVMKNLNEFVDNSSALIPAAGSAESSSCALM